jgi:hypothetical protein
MDAKIHKDWVSQSKIEGRYTDTQTGKWANNSKFIRYPLGK